MEMNSIHQNAVEAILYGHRCALRLKLRLDHPLADDKSISSYDLAQLIVNCFSNAISILSEDDQSLNLSSREFSPSLPHRSYSKKRKIESTNSNENWRDDSPDSIYYDGFLWRKYGQKTIKKSNQQRSYYRCSYNIDHDCKARKHEQKIKDNPPVYRTTYFGHHTCKIKHNQDAIFTNVCDSTDDLKSARMIRFGKDLEKENHSGDFSLSVKQEDDLIRNETIDQSYDIQHVMEENLSSSSSLSLSSGSYPLPSSSGSESDAFDSDLLLDNPDSWDLYDQFDFGLR